MKFTEINQNRMTCSECGGPAFSTLILAEKHDACYNKVRSRYKVWPSAYASGALVQCRKKGAANWGNKTKNEGVAEGEKSPMFKDSQKADRIRSLKNLIAIAREQGRQLRVQELELELKKLQGVTEMDKSAPQPGRDGRVSHSTYGSRDKGGSKGPEREARPITAKKAAQHALDILKKQGVAEGSLTEFAPGSGRGDDSEDPYKYPKPEQYRRSADYFGQFEAGHFDREDFDDAAGVFKGYWGPTQIAYFKFDNPAKTGSDDPGMGWYYEPESSASNDTASAKPAAFDNAEQRKQQELGMIDAFLKSGLTPKPGSQIYNLMKRHGVAESNDDVWGPQGNFAGDRPVNLGGSVSKKLGVGDTVTYFGEKATILAMSKDRTVSRIHLKSGITQNVKTSDLKRVGQDVEEGWKDKVAPLAMAGAMAMGAGGAQARVGDDTDTSINRITGKPIAAQQATDTEPARAESPKGYSKEYKEFLQKAANPNRFGRYMISVEKAQELLKNMQEGVAGKKPVDEDYNPEYDDEAGMADNNLETMRRAVEGIDDLIDSGDNLPEWCQEKIAVAKSMLVSVWDYMRSEQDRGATAELTEEFDLIESIVDRIAAHNGVDAEVVWEDLESLTEDELYAFAVTSQLNEDWSKVNKQDRTAGMSRKAVKAYRRENPGSKLQTAVTTKPSKLKKGSKASKRRKSYCSRSRGQMKMHNISCAKTPDKAICKARRRWNC